MCPPIAEAKSTLGRLVSGLRSEGHYLERVERKPLRAPAVLTCVWTQWSGESVTRFRARVQLRRVGVSCLLVLASVPPFLEG